MNVKSGFGVKASVTPGFKSGGEYLLTCNIDGGRGGRVDDIIIVGRGYEVKGVFDEERRGGFDVDPVSQSVMHATLGEVQVRQL